MVTMRTIALFKGLPASGKSRKAAELVNKEPNRWVRINRDDLRCMVCGPNNDPYKTGDRNVREDLIRNFKNELVRQAIREGFDVILDDTHLVPMTVKKLHALAMSIGDVKVIEFGVNESVETCIERDAKREGFAKVGEKVIRDMARAAGLDKGRKLSDKEAYYPPRWVPGGEGAGTVTGYDPDSTLPKAIICDLDGTLAFLNGRSPYDATNCDQDPPNLPVIECVKAMHAAGCQILFTSGREDKYREPTEKFIAQWVQVHNPDLDKLHGNFPLTVTIPHLLFMRSSGDMRKDSIIKRELFDANIAGKYNVVFVCDDRNQVVDEWRSMGLCCMQVAPGAF